MSFSLITYHLLENSYSAFRTPTSKHHTSSGRSFFLFFLDLFIYLLERERQSHRRREKQAPCGEPDSGLHPGAPGSRPGPKAGAKPLSHPGIPERSFYSPSLLELAALFCRSSLPCWAKHQHFTVLVLGQKWTEYFYTEGLIDSKWVLVLNWQKQKKNKIK